MPGCQDVGRYRRALDNFTAKGLVSAETKEIPRFSGISDRVAPNTLSARLKDMEEHGLIARRIYSNHPPRLEYQLTEKGKSLAPVLKALRDWGQHHH